MRSLLHRHSTLIGLLSAAFICGLVGAATHWQVFFMVLAVVGTMSIVSRVAYGMRESRELDSEPAQPGSGVRGRFGFDEAFSKPARLLEAYRRAQMTGVDYSGMHVNRSALEQFAEEEQRE